MIIRLTGYLLRDHLYRGKLGKSIIHSGKEAGCFYSNENRDIKYLSNNLIRKVFGDKDAEKAERLVNVMGGNVVWMPSIAEREGEKRGIKIGERIGEARGVSQMTEALKLIKYGGSTTVEDLLKKGVSLEIATAVMNI